MKGIVIIQIMLFSTLLIVIEGCGGGGGGDGGNAPSDISGNWAGVMTMGNITVPLTATLTQDGQNVRIDWVGQYPEGQLSGSFIGTYVDGVFTASQQGGTVTLRFSGNSAKGTIVDSGGTATIEVARI